MTTSDKLQWGILAAGGIARTFARGVAASKTGRLIAIGSRTQASADKFGDEFKLDRRYGSYEALLADPEVEAVYISTPHPMHVEWVIKAAEAGKHILCEKPMGLNHAEAMAAVEAARRHRVFLMEAFMYRCHPQTAKLVELIRNKVIGEVRVIQATFSFHAAWLPHKRWLANELGGGGILDVGCYCTSMARLIAGAAMGKDFAEPVEVKGCAYLGKTGVDEYAIASMKFPGEILAELATGVLVSQESVVRVFGSEGSIFVPSPWFCRPAKDAAHIIVQRHDEKKPRRIGLRIKLGLYSIEADAVAAHRAKDQAPSPCMSWDDSLGNMKTLDAWRAAVGLVYEAEKPSADIPTAHRRPLRVGIRPGMKYGEIAGVGKRVSRLILGTMFEGAHFMAPHAAVLCDDFVEQGGNCFDTAFIYNGGLSEKIFGQWVKNRGLRREIVMVVKGAHTPGCEPDNLTRELMISLDRLQTDYADIYMMHRDNPDVPVGEFVDVLNQHQKAGRVRAFGGSNWPLARVEAANRYAQSKGLTAFAAVSNNFSLARMVDPVWEGCIAASDVRSRAWFRKKQLSLLAWSSQARGFFVSAHPKRRDDAELVRCWHSDDNFRRLERVKKLAGERKVLPINIALAYVLCQPFPTFALIGPRTLAETRTSCPALEVELSPKELRWLNLEI
ncbi:MAG: aldo/keto reductase [Verrucomicrobia bacterium]|nr:aldo/keto reductase [Verrucomicrobiota bacterium]